MNKSGRKVNPDFFKQQNNDVQVFVGKRPNTSNIVSTKIIHQGSTRSSATLSEETKTLSSRLLGAANNRQISKTARKEPIPPQEESLYEMTRYLNKQQMRDYIQDEDSFQLTDSESRLFKPARQHTLRMDDLDDSYHESDTLDQEEEYDPNSPQSIHESPIKKPLPSHRRSLSARMLPNMGRGFVTTRREESEEDSPIKEIREEVTQKRKPPRYPPSILTTQLEENSETIDTPPRNTEVRKLQEEIGKLSGEVNFLRREKSEQTKTHNDKVRSLQERHIEELQSQQKRFENILEEKETRVSDLQRENERLREQLGVADKSKDGQDTNKLLNDLESKRKSITNMENDRLVLMDQIEKMKYDIGELNRQLKESEVKIRHKEENLNSLSNKIETQEKEIKNLKEREFKEINDREKALAMFTESEKANQQLQEKLKNLEFQAKQLQRENEMLSQRCNTVETTKIQLEKTNDQLRAKIQTIEEELNHISQDQSLLHQDREQFLLNKQRSQQELENYRREINNLRETISILKNDSTHHNNLLPKGVYNDSPSYSNPEIESSSQGYNYQPNSNFNRKNTNVTFSSYSSQGLIGNESSNPYSNSNPKNNREIISNQNQYEYLRENQSSRLQNNRYQQAETIKEIPIMETPKQSATTAKVMSIINRESPKERQYNRNKIMGTSYSLTPFAVDETASNSQTSNIDEQLMQLSLEKTRLEGDMQKLFSMGIKSIAAKKQKMSLELRLEEIEKQSSQLKMRLRNMNY